MYERIKKYSGTYKIILLINRITEIILSKNEESCIAKLI